MSGLNWEAHCWRPGPDPAEFPELVEAHGAEKAHEMMAHPREPGRYQFSVVESSVPEGMTLAEWRQRRA